MDFGTGIAVCNTGHSHSKVIEKPNSALTQALIANAAKYGLVLLACGFYGNVIRFLPALTATDDVVEEGLAKFSELFNTLA